MYKLASVDPQKLNFNGNLSYYEGKIDPVYDTPLASLANEKGMLVNDNKIILKLNNNQYFHDVLTRFETLNFHAPFTNYLESDGMGKELTLLISSPRIPVYLTSSIASDKCYLNINTELKQFLTDGLGFKLRLKIRKEGNFLQFVLHSVEIPDMFDGDMDYLDHEMEFEADESSDEFIDTDEDFYIDMDDLEVSDEELIDYKLKLNV